MGGVRNRSRERERTHTRKPRTKRKDITKRGLTFSCCDQASDDATVSLSRTLAQAEAAGDPRTGWHSLVWHGKESGHDRDAAGPSLPPSHNTRHTRARRHGAALSTAETQTWSREVRLERQRQRKCRQSADRRALCGDRLSPPALGLVRRLSLLASLLSADSSESLLGPLGMRRWQPRGCS